MRSLDEAKEPWSRIQKLGSLADLRDAVTNPADGSSFTTGLRSACWKAFFLFESLECENWSSTLSASRSAYTSLREHFLRPLEHPEELGSAIDPLSENSESPWVALRKDEALRAEIFQDVERCMPDNVYFRQPSTQNTLLDTLFIFCKLNSDIGYRQGMHEVLAPILWVVERDSVAPKPAGPYANESLDDLLINLYNHDFVEHDSFTLFSLIMENAKLFYAPAEESPKGLDKSVAKDSPMMVRSKRIFEDYLPLVDPELATHLTEIDVVPQIFLMRWVRLLFGREFPFDDVLVVWDVLFSQDTSLELVDLICIAMLLRIRWQLIDADTNDAFTLLLRYPQFKDHPRSFVDDALYLRQSLTQEGGSFLIKKYSNKSVAAFSPKERPSSPADSARARSPFGSQFGSPFGSPTRFLPQTGSLEAMLQDAARGVYSRGQKWGVNKVVRDAVEEVKKNVQGLQSGRTSPRLQYHRSQRGSYSNDRRGSIPAESYVSELEERNKELSGMLSGAINELWAWHGAQNEAKGKAAVDGDSLETLSLAIAKVQFVQVYLEDSAMPLPIEVDTDHIISPLKSPSKSKPTVMIAPPTDSKNPGTKTPEPPSSPSKKPINDPPAPKQQPLADESEPAPPPPPPPKIPSTTTASSTLRGLTVANPAPTKQASQRQRGTLAHSSFSWMLGQDESTSDFASASSRSTFPPEMSRRKDKGFLFGDDDEAVAASPISKEPRNKQKQRSGSMADEVEEEEVIDLGPLGKSTA